MEGFVPALLSGRSYQKLRNDSIDSEVYLFARDNDVVSTKFLDVICLLVAASEGVNFGTESFRE